ncbi:uncharacterized protein LOC108742382 [Agrilus planipennis]|uniref:Uncharacterized protein LOC108742382 n=1 Tax=Agrilus planipennis TaxID=224129 RepID=A0A1W4XAL3_AGRPL|nr:uncharacterized protein LOC108742382 [Agrilus planipennis]
MTEDDEIDILGDLSVDSSVSQSENFDISAALGSQNSDLLTCDYTTPLFLDNSGTHALWFSNGNSYFSSELQTEHLANAQQEKVNSSKEIPSTSSGNIVSDSSGWTIKEKGLLCNGVQIFGKNNVCLAKFIGSKSADEVNFYLKHFYEDHLKSMSSDSLNSDTKIVSDCETPASIEEAMVSVSTAKPTVPETSKRLTKNAGRKGSKNDKKGFFFKQTQNLLKINRHFNMKNIRNKRGKFNVINKIRPPENPSSLPLTPTKSMQLQGEEVVKIKKLNPEDADFDVDVDIDIESLSEDESLQTNGSLNKQILTPVPTPSLHISTNDNSCKRNSLTLSRQIKRKFLNNGEGGKTLAHGADGEVIHTTIVDESSAKKATPTGPKKPPIQLIYCRPFNEQFPQPFNVLIHVSALILMDLHAHTCYTEVMGLVGGSWNEKTGQLTVTAYQPCRNTSDSATHCDMCPVTQAKAAENIHAEGLEVVGWFHSHPTFSPEPSQQDIETQVSLQSWLGGRDRPCLGIILTPYDTLGGPSAPSNIRCLIAHKKENTENQFVPYKFKTRIFAEGLHVKEFLDKARKVVEYVRRTNSNNVFLKDYFLDRSLKHQEKFLSSVKMNLIKCESINKMTCDAITNGLLNIVGNY